MRSEECACLWAGPWRLSVSCAHACVRMHVCVRACVHVCMCAGGPMAPERVLRSAPRAPCIRWPLDRIAAAAHGEHVHVVEAWIREPRRRVPHEDSGRVDHQHVYACVCQRRRRHVPLRKSPLDVTTQQRRLPCLHAGGAIGGGHLRGSQEAERFVVETVDEGVPNPSTQRGTVPVESEDAAACGAQSISMLGES